jgi:hypothetical protein
MLTEKEIKFLNFLYKKLKGDHLDYSKLMVYIKKNFKLNDKDSFELAYLYDEHFSAANGDFNNVKNVKRVSYEDYIKSLIPEIRTVMELTKDHSVENYDLEDIGLYKIVNHNGVSYQVYDSTNDILTNAASVYEDTIREDPYPYADYLIDAVFISRGNRNQIAINDANKYVKENLSTLESILEEGNIEEEYENLERAKESINNTLGQLINTTELLDDYLKLHRLGKEEEDQEEYIKLKEQIKLYKEHLNRIQENIVGGYKIKEDMTIDEITDQVDDILYEIDDQIEELIENTKNDLREQKFEEIYEELSDDPYLYFSDRFEIEDFIGQDFVEIDYAKAAKHYVEGSEMSYQQLLAFDNGIHVYVNGRKYYIFW